MGNILNPNCDNVLALEDENCSIGNWKIFNGTHLNPDPKMRIGCKGNTYSIGIS